jgi:hypothetical protein
LNKRGGQGAQDDADYRIARKAEYLGRTVSPTGESFETIADNIDAKQQQINEQDDQHPGKQHVRPRSSCRSALVIIQSYPKSWS